MRYADLERVARSFFGEPRQSGGSHTVFKTPWAGDPRVNIQDIKGQAKPYQVKQVLAAIDKLEQLQAEADESEDDKEKDE